MKVNINEFHSRVSVVNDDEARRRREIVDLVLAAVREEQEHARRVDAERRVTSGVRDEIEGEE